MALKVKVAEVRDSSRFEDGAIRQAIHRHIIKEILTTALCQEEIYETLNMCKYEKPKFINTKPLIELYNRELGRWYKLTPKFIKNNILKKPRRREK